MLTQPYFWLSLSQVMMMAAAASISLRDRLQRILNLSRFFMGMSGLVYVIMTSSLMEQDRLPGNIFLQIAGLFLCGLSAFLMISVITARFLSATEDSRVNFQVRGIYRWMRHPSYLAMLLLELASALIFRSVIGLLFFPLQFMMMFFLMLIEEQNLAGILGETYHGYLKRVRQRFFPQIKKSAALVPVQYPFRNLVFKGGGIRGVAYTGVLEMLYEYDVLSRIERVAGTSAGAITACLVSFRLPRETLFSLVETLDYKKVPQSSDPFSEPKFLGRLLRTMNDLAGDLNCTDRLLKKYGWYSSGYFYTWIQDVIAGQCEGNGMASFAEFKRRGFRDLYICAVNASKNNPEMFSAETTPDVAVADAVRMSISIPLFFEALQFDGKKFGSGDYYVDGGIYNNYPIKYFDQSPYIDTSHWVKNKINWETLGCYLYTPEHCERRQPRIENIWGFLENMLYGLTVEAREQYFKRDLLDHQRTIMISDCCVMPTEFDIPAGSERYEELVNSGRTATENFLKNYHLPFPL
jgi:NTE family protein